MNDFDARMEALRSRFRARANDEARRLITALEAGDHPELMRASHSLAGNAGMFGFAELGQQAALIERAIDEDLGSARVTALTHALIAALGAVASGKT